MRRSANPTDRDADGHVRARARAALHAKAPVMLSLSLPNCAESPQGHALVKAEVARHLTQMITALQEAAADTMPT